MSTVFPGALDDFSNPSPTSPRSAPSLAGEVSDKNDALEALQAKVGADNSAVATSLDYRTRTLEGYVLTPAQGRVTVAASATSGTAINAAIAALPANGGTIILSAGTHTFDVPVQISKDLIIDGVGSLVTLVRFDPGAGGWPAGGAFRMADTTQRRVVMRNMRIESSSNGVGTAIDASKFINSQFENLRIGSSTNGPNVGIRFPVVGTYYNHVKDCTIATMGTAPIGVEFSSNANSNMITNTKISTGGTNATGVLVNGAHSILIDHLTVDTASDIIAVDCAAGSADITMVGCYFELSTIGVRIASGVESVRIVGGYIASATTANVQDNGAVGLTIDNAWLQFDPYSSIDRTGVVKNKVNGSNVPGNTYQADDFAGIIAWDFDPVHIQAGVAAANGTVYLMRVKLRYAATITNLFVSVTAAGVGPVAGQSFLGLINSAGTLVAVTADAGTALTTPGLLTIALAAPYVAAAGDYWVGLVSNAATPPQLARACTLGLAGTFTLGSTAANRRYATNGAGATALANITPASNSAAGLTFWAAVG